MTTVAPQPTTTPRRRHPRLATAVSVALLLAGLTVGLLLAFSSSGTARSPVGDHRRARFRHREPAPVDHLRVPPPPGGADPADHTQPDPPEPAAGRPSHDPNPEASASPAAGLSAAGPAHVRLPV